jgi:hypothetical protein
MNWVADWNRLKTRDETTIRERTTTSNPDRWLA